MNEHPSHIEEIIIRQLDNSASPEEVRLLNEWLDKDPGNKIIQEEMTNIWKDSQSVLFTHQFDAKRGWDKISHTIEQVPSERPASVIRLFQWRGMVAAALLMLVALSGLIFFFQSNTEDTRKYIVAGDANKRLLLPDGTIVELRKGSKINYPDKFNESYREVEFTGEAFFDVQPDPAKPFRISTAKTLVEVLGTSFLVRSSDAIEEVVVSTGKVKFSNRRDSKQQLILTPGHKGELKGNRLTDKVHNNLNMLAWQKAVLEFKETPLNEIVEDINHLYNAKVLMSESVAARASQIKITARFDKQTLEEVLEEIQLTTGLSLNAENNTLVLSDK